MHSSKYKSAGQAMIEYLLILGFAVIVSFKIITGFRGFFQSSMGSLGHILTIHLMTGVCSNNCFFAGYENGREN